MNHPDVIPTQLNIQLADTSRRNMTDLNDPGFGTVFSDHMAVIHYNGSKWETPSIVPYDDFNCPPSLIALHYGQSVFEGMKAFRTTDGTVSVFRPYKHLERLSRSCQRLCIPEPDHNALMESLQTLLRIDHDWVPEKRGNSLYIRPLIFGSDDYLGVRPSEKYTCLIITSPVASYYKEGINPVSLTTNPEYVRAVRGGSGSVKTSGNYGSTLLPAQKARNEGYTQVLWLDAAERKYIEEVGTMNIFFKYKDKLVTPPLEGTILPGIIRDSVIQLAKDWDIPVEEKRTSIDELFHAHENGSLHEIFGSGTAAVISPVGKITHQGKTIETDMTQPGPLTKKLYDEITAIQYGKKADRFSWLVKVDT